MNFDEIKNEIYPWVKKSLSDKETAEDEIINIDIPTKNLIADLIVLFVVEESEGFRVLQSKDIPKEYSIDDLYELACQNLTKNITFKIIPLTYGGYGVWATRDGLNADGNHDAGALCLNHVWEFIADEIGENFIVAVPSKDVVTFVPQSQSEAFSKMKELTLNLVKNWDKPLTKHLFLYDIEQKKFTVYE